MSKGNRKREAAAARREQELLLQQEQKKVRRRNRILTGVVAVVAVAAILLVSLTAVEVRRREDPDYQMHHTMVATSANYEVSQAMMSYLVQVTASQYITRNESMLDILKLDTSVSLQEQTCYFDSNKTWFDYFAESTLDTVERLLAFAEQARADGHTLSDEDVAEIDETLDSIKLDTFGGYITKEDVRDVLEINYLAEKQESAVQEMMTATDEQVEAYYAANEKSFLEASYAYYYIPFGSSSNYTAEEAEALADILKNSSAEQFEQKVKSELLRLGQYDEDKVDDAYQGYVRTGYQYSEEDGISDWLFGGAKAGDTYMTESQSARTVYICLAEPARNTEPRVDVRHILFTADTYKTDEAAQAKANEVWEEWKKGEATETSFSQLAMAYSEDSNASSGGLYTDVSEGQMVDTFNDWCFDESRKAGDTGLVKTDYGYHLMYFVQAAEAWYADARETYLDTLYDTCLATYVSSYAVTTDSSKLRTIVM